MPSEAESTRADAADTINASSEVCVVSGSCVCACQSKQRVTTPRITNSQREAEEAARTRTGVEPAGRGFVERGADDGRAKDAHLEVVAAPGEQDVLRERLGEGVGVGVLADKVRRRPVQLARIHFHHSLTKEKKSRRGKISKKEGGEVGGESVVYFE